MSEQEMTKKQIRLDKDVYINLKVKGALSGSNIKVIANNILRRSLKKDRVL